MRSSYLSHPTKLDYKLYWVFEYIVEEPKFQILENLKEKKQDITKLGKFSLKTANLLFFCDFFPSKGILALVSYSKKIKEFIFHLCGLFQKYSIMTGPSTRGKMNATTLGKSSDQDWEATEDSNSN